MKKNLNNYLRCGIKSKVLMLTGILWLSAITLVFAQQTNTVKGTVYDANNATLPGATILVKGTTLGTTSDVEGNFTLQVPKSATTLVVSFVGMVSQEIAITNEPLKILLLSAATDLDQVVVVGYGVKKKSMVTGAISSISAAEIKTTSTSRADQAIQGKTAGVMVLPQSGAPGSSTNIRIRGVGSNQGANPIYLVNGMRVNDLNSINPSDIESIEVLKDAASAAIYGAEGGNGVVLITLKSGKSNNSQISYDFQYGSQQFNTKMKMMDASQYKQWQLEAGQPIKDRFGADTDWINALFQNANMQQHHLSFSGGNDKTTYLISGGYMSQDGIIGGSKSKYDRFTTLINVKSDVKKWLQIGGDFNYMHSSANGITQNSEYNSVAGAPLIMDPLTPITYSGTPAHVQTLIDEGNAMIKDDNGNYYATGENITGEMANPFMILQTTHNNTVLDQITGTGFLTLKPIKGLSITTRIGTDVSFGINHLWVPRYFGSTEAQNTTSYVQDNVQKTTRWVWDNFASYSKAFGEHSITAMVGYSAQKASLPIVNTLSLTSQPMVAEADQYASQSGTTDRLSDRVYGYNRTSTMTSIFGRLSYDYKGKYLLEGSVRRDGASEFPTNAKFGVFPAISAGWVLSKEDFMKIDFLSYLKVRASWGQNGSRSNLQGNEDKALWNLLTRYPDANGNFVTGGWITKLTNNDLKWETSAQTDFGFDARFLNNKLSFTFDYFDRKTKDLISQGAFAPSTGNISPSVNLGSIDNKGTELELGYKNDDNEFKYGVSFNVSFVSNKVTDLTVPAPVDGTLVRNRALTRFELNEPIWYFRGYKTDGVFKDEAEANAYNTKYGTAFTAGDLKVVDVDGSGTITASDITKIGDPNPNMIYGGNFYMNYKNFDFNMVLQGVSGNDIYMAWFREDRTGSNKPAYFFEDRWTSTNTDASMPKPNNSSLYLYNGDKMIGNGSYLRVKQLQLGYTIPGTILSKAGINSLRLYVSLDDMITFTKYKGLDPEVGSNVNSLQGVDRGHYPNAGRLIFGLSLNL
jgi:TonB-dependent starch-binding outer membrane protein SusC